MSQEQLQMKLLEDSSGSHGHGGDVVSQLLNVSRRGQTRTKMWSCIEKKPQVGCHGSHVVRRAPKQLEGPSGLGIFFVV